MNSHGYPQLQNLGKSRKGLLLVLSGPSGVGKGTICRALLQKYKDIEYSVSATTRRPRPGEVHGKDYFFYQPKEFQDLIDANALLEWARVYDNCYGTPREYVELILQKGKDCILEIDVQGALQIKKKMPDGIFIFIVPPTLDELIRRITGRGTENTLEIDKRMSKVEEELSHIKDYQYMVVNDDVDKAVEKVRSIIIAERCRIQRQNCTLLD